MNVICDRKEMENGIITASKAVNQKSPLPILSHLLVRAEQDTLRFSATDLEMVIDCTIPAQVVRPGACTVPARLFTEIVTQLSEPEIALDLDGSRLEVKTRTSNFWINTLSAEEYPVLPEPDAPVALTLPSEVFRDMIKAVLFAAAPPEETRAILTGVLTQIDNQVAVLTTTDGRRLARMRRKFGEALGASYKSVLPARAMQELMRLLGDGAPPLEVTPAHGQVFFKFGHTKLVARLLEEGKFPDCDSIIPRSFSRSFVASQELLMGAVRRALIMAQEKDTPRLLRLELQPEEMIIRSNTPDLGEACQHVPIRFDGEPMHIAFNGRYLLDVVQNMGGKDIQMQLNDPLSMTLLQPVGDEDALYMLMPIRVKDPVAAG